MVEYVYEALGSICSTAKEQKTKKKKKRKGPKSNVDMYTKLNT